MVFLKEFFKKVDFEKNQQTTRKHAKFPGGKEFKVVDGNRRNAPKILRLPEITYRLWFIVESEVFVFRWFSRWVGPPMMVVVCMMSMVRMRRRWMRVIRVVFRTSLWWS